MKTSFWLVLRGDRSATSKTVYRVTPVVIRKRKSKLLADEIGVEMTLDVDPKVFTEATYEVSGEVKPQHVARPDEIVLVLKRQEP